MAREVITVTTRGLKDFEKYLNEFPERTLEAARLSVNDTAKWARTQSSREMRRQVAFPAQYLDSAADGRLYVSKRAKGNDLEAVITGRHRPTSLARFTSNVPTVLRQLSSPGGRGKRSGLKVRVSPGRTKTMRRAFPLKLRAGNKDIDTDFNVGIALRLPKGTAPLNKRRAVPVKSNSQKSDLYLLYAPSFDQVFQDVAKQFQEPAARRLEAEFLRQFTRLGG